MTGGSTDLRKRRSPSSSSSSEAARKPTNLKKEKASHPADQPCHSPQDSLLSSTSGYTNFWGFFNLAMLLLVCFISLLLIYSESLLLDCFKWSCCSWKFYQIWDSYFTSSLVQCSYIRFLELAKLGNDFVFKYHLPVGSLHWKAIGYVCWIWTGQAYIFLFLAKKWIGEKIALVWYISLISAHVILPVLVTLELKVLFSFLQYISGNYCIILG